MSPNSSNKSVSFLLAGLGTILFLALGIFYIVYIPYYERQFWDYGIALPTMAECVIGLTKFQVGPIFILLAMAIAAKELAIIEKQGLIEVNIGIIIFSLIAIAVTAYSIWGPINTLLGAIQRQEQWESIRHPKL